MNERALTAVAADVPKCTFLGTTGLIYEPPAEFDLATQQRIWALADRVSKWPEVAEAVPGLTNLMLIFKRRPIDPVDLRSRLNTAWSSGERAQRGGHHIDIPVDYGGEGGPHLGDVVAHTGLSVDDVVAIHTAPTYTVFAIGSHPGYCYLGGLDPRLFIPRRQVPLLSIPAGSLSVAGMQTGVAASTGPSGWHTIGIADVTFFDPERSPPSLLQPGDTIRFTARRVLR